MSEPSSSEAAWSTLLEPAPQIEWLVHRDDDPRLGEIIERWRGDDRAMSPGRAVLIGFSQDEGVRRNQGRPGAAQAPREIRHALWRLTTGDASRGIDLVASPPLDLGDVKIAGSLEDSQAALGTVVAAVLAKGAIPVVLGGGHETAFGHFLGYATSDAPVGIINLDAHLDVRPLVSRGGHSGSPFRQALESQRPPRYVCLGAQPFAVAASHLQFLEDHGGTVIWADDMNGDGGQLFQQTLHDLSTADCTILLSVDADVVALADVPGVSAPNPLGLRGAELALLAQQAGRHPAVSSLELVEINPAYDRDGQSVRWAAVVIWSFLMGLAERNSQPAT